MIIEFLIKKKNLFVKKLDFYLYVVLGILKLDNKLMVLIVYEVCL